MTTGLYEAASSAGRFQYRRRLELTHSGGQICCCFIDRRHGLLSDLAVLDDRIGIEHSTKRLDFDRYIPGIGDAAIRTNRPAGAEFSQRRSRVLVPGIRNDVVGGCLFGPEPLSFDRVGEHVLSIRRDHNLGHAKR